MKTFALIILSLFFILMVQVQDLQSSKPAGQALPDKPVFFYSSLPDSTINASITQEHRSLSNFFMVDARCFFFDSVKVDKSTLAKPDFESNNIYLNINTVKARKEAAGTSVINMMIQQFTGIIVKKYKLDIPVEEEVLLSDYISGYYMACRNKTLKVKYAAADVENNLEFNEVAMDLRQLAFRQGETDFNNNYLKRRIVTLADLIHSGLAYSETSL